MKKVSRAFSNVMERYLPDAFLIAIILSVIVYILSIFVTKQSPMAVLYSWNTGFWALLSFAMQMSLIVVVGGALARAPAFKKVLGWIAGLAHSPAQAVVITAAVSIMTQWLQSGFSLIFCAFLAREMARRIRNVDYRLLVAAGYCGICVCQSGIGGSVLLTIAAEGGASAIYPEFTGAIPISETIFAPQTLIACAAILIVLPILFKFMTPSPEDTFVVDPSVLLEEEIVKHEPTTPAERVEYSKIMWVITWFAGILVFVYSLTKTSLSINGVIFIMLFLGILFHGNLRNYIDAFQASVSAAGPIIMQFPLYAGIMGMMTLKNVDGVSLATVFAGALVSISNERTLPLFTWLSAGFLNIFIPSGGGQWAVQGPIVLPAAAAMGVPLSKVSLALLWGDAWTNLIQPFWALPVLGLAGLKAKDIMGYLLLALIASGIIIGCCLYFIV